MVEREPARSSCDDCRHEQHPCRWCAEQEYADAYLERDHPRPPPSDEPEPF